jgi:hypothetical protein
MFIGNRDRVFMRANVRAALHIQRWRPNGWTHRDPNWYKHSLEQSAQVMGVAIMQLWRRSRSAQARIGRTSAKR